MACSCHDHHATPATASALSPLDDPRWRRVLWVALILNLLMFVIELWAGLQAHSVSLLADAVDFAGDAANYGISLAVLGMATIWRSRAALVKGLSMAGYGVFIVGKAVWAWHSATVPEPLTMGVVGGMALLVNAGVAVLLYRFRSGDANRRSVWLCSRNDALSNLAVMLAALGVFGTGSAWPDLLVAAVMAVLALTAGIEVVRSALAELRGEAPHHTLSAQHHH